MKGEKDRCGTMDNGGTTGMYIDVFREGYN